jgi:ATP-dependent DNA helicase RecG
VLLWAKIKPDYAKVGRGVKKRCCRIGDFLKELHLTEGTGFPTIYNAMADNGSPNPIFETDEDTYVMVTIPIHYDYKGTKSDQVSDQANILIFNSLDDIIAFSKQDNDGAYDGVSDGVKEIIEAELHTKVEGLLVGAKSWIKRKDLFAKIGLSNHSTNREKYLDPLIDFGWIQMEYPDNPTHPKQRYKITERGMIVIQLIKS